MLIALPPRRPVGTFIDYEESLKALARLGAQAAERYQEHHTTRVRMVQGCAGRAFAAYEQALGELLERLHEHTALSLNALIAGTEAAKAQVQQYHDTDAAVAAEIGAAGGTAGEGGY